MKIVLQVVAIVLFGYIFERMLPWYSIAFVAFVFGYVLNSESNFLGGFLGVAVLWGIKMALISSSASVDLAGKVARIMAVNDKWILVAVTLVLGGLVGGLASVTGASLKAKTT